MHLTTEIPGKPYVSRGGLKLDFAIGHFGIDCTDRVCADFGCNAGGFTDCLLRRGARTVYAIDTGYGAFDWSLRNDRRVVTMERTNAMHVVLPEPVDLVVIDVAWTKQRHILPAARRVLGAGGEVVTLVKPHYESEPAERIGGVLKADRLEPVLRRIDKLWANCGFACVSQVRSPIAGAKGNIEVLCHLRKIETPTTPPTG
jgi:23S rRNA (cytidine1920-2'-O)/16S rRNA (cytidine1409-2'-O)-methyltransferase